MVYRYDQPMVKPHYFSTAFWTFIFVSDAIIAYAIYTGDIYSWLLAVT